MSASTFSVPLGSMPLSPTENIGCKSWSSRPRPARSSPSPESTSALRRGEAGVPIRMCSRMPTPRSVSVSGIWSIIQLTVAMPFAVCFVGAAAKVRVKRCGAEKRF